VRAFSRLPAIGAAALLFLALAGCDNNGRAPESADRAGAGGTAAAPAAPQQDVRPAARSLARFQLVPPLDCRPSDRDGCGTVTLAPVDPVPASSRHTWTVTYTAVEPGIDPGGFIILQISPWWGWTPPQTMFPGLPGHVKVTTSASGPSIEAAALPLSRVLVLFKEEGLQPGETVTFTYANAAADRFAEAEEMFQVLVDADADGHYATVPGSPRIRILPHEPVRLSVNVPCQTPPGGTVSVTVASLDALGNWTPFPVGASCRVRVTRDGEAAGSFVFKPALSWGEPQSFLYAFVLPMKEGVYFFEANGVDPEGKEGAALDLEGMSNPLLCRAGKRSLNLYFGDIHGHSRLSDGTGTPEDYYSFAREVSRLDIAALTDHDSYGTFPLHGEPWERIEASARTAYKPGVFVTFLGYEWTNWRYGHRNVYFSGDEGEIFSALDARYRTPEALWKSLANLGPREVMTIAHHPGGGPVPVDWSRAPPDGLERLVEICSIHGSSEHYGCQSSIGSPVEGAFVYDALNRGYRLGLIGSGDTHDGHPGQRSAGAPTGGIFGVFAPDLTREAVWDALEKRHTYATTGVKIILFARVCDAPMGSEVEWSGGPVPVAVRVVGCGELEAIEVVRDGEAAFRHECAGVEATLLIEDPDPPAGTSWYVVKVIQKDGHMAWSSPVWVTTGRDE